MGSDVVSSPDGVVDVEVSHEDCSSWLGFGMEGFDSGQVRSAGGPRGRRVYADNRYRTV